MNLYNIIILITSIISAAILLWKGQPAGKAGRYLALYLVVEGILMILFGLVYTRGIEYSPAADAFLTVFLMVNPLLYWIPIYYITSSDTEQDNLVHYFYPAIALFSLTYFICIVSAPEDAALLYKVLRGEMPYLREVSSSFRIIEALDYVRMSVSCLCTVILLAYSFFAFLSYRRTLTEYYSNLDNKSIFYVVVLLVLMCAKAALLFTSALYPDVLRLDWYHPVMTGVFVIFYVMTIIVALHIKFTATDLKRLISEAAAQQEAKAAAAKGDDVPAAEIIESRLARMVEDRFFTDPDINLLEFSAKIKVNRDYVARFIHSRYDETFSAYVNRLRVEYSVELLNEKGAQVADVAERCGFATTSTFYRNFSRVMGCSPRDYSRKF